MAAEVPKLNFDMQRDEARIQLTLCCNWSWWCGLPALHLLGFAWYGRWIEALDENP